MSSSLPSGLMVFLLILLLASLMGNAGVVDEFIITYWCGPPLKETTLERYKEIKDAGFNIAAVSIDGAFKKEDNLRLLDIAKEVGLKCVIADQRLTWDIASKPNWEKIVDEVIKDYSSHPALHGYFIMDEPNASHFPLLAKVVSYIKEKDPKHIAYINLFPDYATPEQLGTPTYKDHVDLFIRTVKPQLLSYDYYTFLQGGDRETFFENLRVVKEASEKARIPFIVVIQMVTHGPYRDLTKGEIAWQAYNCLAYGAKGICYFTYWTPPDDPVWHWRNGIISWDGKRTAHYEEVKEVNSEVKVLGDFLNKLKSIDAYHTGKVPRGGKPLPVGTPIKRVEGGDATLGFFKDKNGTIYCLVVNMDYRNPKEFKIYTERKPKLFNLKTRKWRDKSLKKEEGIGYFELTLPAGSGALLKF
ncbi:hypothetical protein H5T88_00130 [bacterium]|nr:hypothetical protein [bacterium]